jgi:molybdopterin converting factor small subunit
MSVKLNLPSILAKLADNQRTIELEASTVGEAVSAVATRYPNLAERLRDPEGRPYQFVTFFLNDRDIRLQGGFDAPVKDGDEITVVPALAGG